MRLASQPAIPPISNQTMSDTIMIPLPLSALPVTRTLPTLLLNFGCLDLDQASSPSRHIRTCYGMLVGLRWPQRGTTPAPFRHSSDTKTSSTRCDTPNCPLPASKASGEFDREFINFNLLGEAWFSAAPRGREKF